MKLYLIFLLRMVMGGHNYFDRKLSPWPGGKWVGTAPICDASAGDCPGNDAPYTHYGFENSGPDEGEACYIGAKSFCTSYKIWDDWSEEGTAPYCDADCSDCPDAYECIAEARYGDRGESTHVGDMCWQVPNWWGLTERKAFCGRPAKEQQYLGCFLVTSDHTSLRYGPYSTSGGYTIETCREKCKQYEFFALWQGQCSCDEYYSNVIEHGSVDSLYCFPTRIGGFPLGVPFPAAMSVFRNYYRGCFKDVSNDRALRYGPYSGHTIDSCRDKCKSYYFFALQNGGYCFCESNFIHITKHGVSSGCSSQGTGGNLANSVYENYWCSQAWSQPHMFFCFIAFKQVLEYKEAASTSTAVAINDMVELIKKNDKDNKEIKTNNKIKFYLFVTITGAIFINVICLGYWCICKFKKRKCEKYHVTSTYDQESDIE